MRPALLAALLPFLGLALPAASFGCSNQKPAPLYASSAGEAGYAERFPDQLASARGRMAEHQSKSTRMMQSFNTYPGELKDPSWPVVLDVVDKADTAGRSGAYAERLGEVENVAAF